MSNGLTPKSGAAQGARTSRAYTWTFRWGPWLVAALGIALAAYALAADDTSAFRIACLTLGSVLCVAGVALPRVIGEIALDAHGFKANMASIERVDPSALAAAITEAAEATIPDEYPRKAAVVRELTAR